MTGQQRTAGDEVITHECVCMTAPCRAHSTVELETSVSHARAHAHASHSHIQRRRPFHAATERVRIASELKRWGRGGGRQRCTCCCISLVIQAECQQAFWQQRSDRRECTILIGSFKKQARTDTRRQDDVMASGMRRQFAAWIAGESAGWAVATAVLIIVSPGRESVRHPRFVCSHL